MKRYRIVYVPAYVNNGGIAGRDYTETVYEWADSKVEALIAVIDIEDVFEVVSVARDDLK